VEVRGAEEEGEKRRGEGQSKKEKIGGPSGPMLMNEALGLVRRPGGHSGTLGTRHGKKPKGNFVLDCVRGGKGANRDI